MLCKLRKPLVRRVGGLVVRVTAEGIELRGHRRRKRLLATWAQIASLAQPDRPMMHLAETVDGRAVLAALGIREPGLTDVEGERVPPPAGSSSTPPTATARRIRTKVGQASPRGL